MKRVSRRHADSFTLETLEPRSMMAADLVPGGITLLSTGFSSPGVVPQPFVFSVVNMGDRRAPIGTTVRFYLSRDAVLDSGDRAVRDSVLPVPVRPGERVTINKVLKAPAGMDGGSYRVIMAVDPDNHLAESDESNNALPSAARAFYLPPKIESLEIDKRFIRPGSTATLTARNVTQMDPDAGEVRFYRSLGFAGYPLLLGVGTREGNDYSLTFAADESWLMDSNQFIAVAVKHTQNNSYEKSTTVEGRNIGPTIGAFSFAPTSIVRGQTVTFTATGVSSNARYVGVFFDTNFDGEFQPSMGNPYQNSDRVLVDCTQSGSTWTGSFTVPEWFPSAPSRIFIVTNRQTTFASRVYSTLLSAH